MIAIQCEGIGKRYQIGQREPYRTLRESLTQSVTAPLRWIGSKGKQQAESNEQILWALREISLEVRHGEVLGIIGRNGSGKSTLLKILSRITKPTEGNAQIFGRVGTLLEVGTGFHLELTGRENIYLYGAILGMSRAEIARKFDEIVEFSECGRMLDTPMKRFSSGLYIRLAFAVAAHLETEILLADEVLAVGDAAFQKRCLGKMGEVARQGRTVLFVSHNMLAVESLCTRAICLHAGQLILEGSPSSVTSRYLREWLPGYHEKVYDDIHAAPGNDVVRLRRCSVRAFGEHTQEALTIRTPLVVEFEYWRMREDVGVDLVAELYNERGAHVFSTGFIGREHDEPGLYKSRFLIHGDLLNNGTYGVNLIVRRTGRNDAEELAYWQDLVTFELRDVPSDLPGYLEGQWPGVVRPDTEWKTERIGALP